jgi:PAS domain S-box-containing protein
MIGRSVMDLAREDAREREAPDTLARVHRGERVEPFDTVRRRNDGSLIDVSMTVSAIRDADGVVIGASSVARDITASKQLADRTLAEAQDRFRGTFESAPIGMGLSDLDGRYVQVNQALCEITGYTAEQLCATSFHAITHPDDRAQDHELIAALQSGALDRCHREKRYLHASGEPVWVALDATILRDRAGRPQHLLSQVVDITQRRALENELRHLAVHDPLTGLVNRRSLEAELDRHVAYVNRYGDHGALLVLDLDHFKTVNDTLTRSGTTPETRSSSPSRRSCAGGCAPPTPSRDSAATSSPCCCPKPTPTPRGRSPRESCTTSTSTPPCSEAGRYAG